MAWDLEHITGGGRHAVQVMESNYANQASTEIHLKGLGDDVVVKSNLVLAVAAAVDSRADKLRHQNPHLRLFLKGQGWRKKRKRYQIKNERSQWRAVAESKTPNYLTRNPRNIRHWQSESNRPSKRAKPLIHDLPIRLPPSDNGPPAAIKEAEIRLQQAG